MTPAEQSRAARSARRLAMEIVNGRQLELNEWSYCGCAAHYVAIGAGLDPSPPEGLDQWGSPARAIDMAIPSWGHGLLTEATHAAALCRDQAALVFPLLATADALDALAKQASGTAP